MDTLSAAVVWVGSDAATQVRGFIAVNVALTTAWVGVAVLAGREYTRRRDRLAPSTAGPPVEKSPRYSTLSR